MQIPKTTLAKRFGLKYPFGQQGMAVNISDVDLIVAGVKEKILPTLAGAGLIAKQLRNKIIQIRKRVKGKFGVNLMVSLEDFDELLDVCIEEKVDFVTLGAGFSKDAIRKLKEKSIFCFVIVSSLRAAKLAAKLEADGLILEAPDKAGGHLGIQEKDPEKIKEHLKVSVFDLLEEIIPVLREKNFEGSIVVAGGITRGWQMKKAFNMGADLIGFGQFFAMTNESGASDDVKQEWVKAKKTKIIMSPVGLPGRVIDTQETDNLPETPDNGRCRRCLAYCKKNYCIFEALQNSTTKKNQKKVIPLSEKLIFASDSVGEINNIISVKQRVQQLKQELERA
ncbi:hypothetical protein COS74_01310 [bacterium CG06_land_8_20_14_3_00_33_50]|nr:MAG: hypothetical protein AUJ93_02480 [bacterium CG2_30_33_46]PIR67616.1 MAG: hypothetical protein COU50_02340 [bacterium CG10_big_fil_rev_8_21_14_0_10_33_18]PIU76960.1 MAG: hypothetical protein COS74_01310 [bacterium CG06_land_8_20_14_3_00_33_50]PJA72631.1 MAG: hypothetical protein CO152_00450 [bacterium CG_4_9_14_3_um_filter_33_26]